MTRYEWLVEQLSSARPDACLEWPWSSNGNGYGQVWHAGRLWPTHRLAYMLTIGIVPDGLELDHLCRNRACFNPAHLEPVTRAINVRRGDAPRIARARQRAKTHCPAGHPLSGDNLLMRPSGWRRCRACHREQKRESARRSRERKLAA